MATKFEIYTKAIDKTFGIIPGSAVESAVARGKLANIIRDAIDESFAKAEAALAAERARYAALVDAARGLVEYRDSVGALNFQLEKADDFITAMLRALGTLDAAPTTEPKHSQICTWNIDELRGTRRWKSEA